MSQYKSSPIRLESTDRNTIAEDLMQINTNFQILEELLDRNALKLENKTLSEIIQLARSNVGLDADTLDGKHASEFVSSVNTVLTGNIVIGSGPQDTLTINANIISNVSGLENFASSYITLNSDFTFGIPYEDGGIIIKRGSQYDAKIEWIESIKRFCVTRNANQTTPYRILDTNDYGHTTNNSGINADRLDDKHLNEIVNGSVNKIAKFTSSNRVSDSVITENNNKVGINVSDPSEVLDVNGNIKANTAVLTNTLSSPLIVNTTIKINNLNCDMLDGYHASSIQENNIQQIPVSNTSGKLDNNWLNTGHNNGIDSDTLDGYHASSFLLTTGGVVTGNLSISGDLTVTGATTYINSQQLQINDNIIILNSNFNSGTPLLDSGIEILRGDENPVKLLWKEDTDKLVLDPGAGEYYEILTENSTISWNKITDIPPLTFEITGQGFVVNTSNGFVPRSIQVSGNGVSISNSDGIDGNPVITIFSDTDNTPNSLVYRDSQGNFSAGSITANAFVSTGADLAEKYTIKGEYGVGDVICISQDDNYDCEVCNEPISQSIVGVLSTNPGLKMNKFGNGAYVALKGRVLCKIYGKVNKGEPLVSYYNGKAISINYAKELGFNINKPGIIFAKALQDGENNVIEVIVL